MSPKMSDAIEAARKIERELTVRGGAELSPFGNDALLIARALLSLTAPGKDVVEDARAVAEWIPSAALYKELVGNVIDKITDKIAAAMTAHAAKERADEREECAAECERIADGGTAPAGAYSCAEHVCAAAIRARKP